MRNLDCQLIAFTEAELKEFKRYGFKRIRSLNKTRCIATKHMLCCLTGLTVKHGVIKTDQGFVPIVYDDNGKEFAVTNGVNVHNVLASVYLSEIGVMRFIRDVFLTEEE